MFTIDQIKAAHSRVKSGADFPRYVQDLIQLGVRSYETKVADGDTTYQGDNQFRVQSGPKYTALDVADSSDSDQFEKELRDHQNGKTDFPTFCSQCARLGVEKWIVDLRAMTCTYYDQEGNNILEESIPG